MSASSSTTRMRAFVESGELGTSGGSLSDMNGFSGERQLDMEAGAGAGPAIHFYGAPMFAHDSVSNRESESGAFLGALGGEERVVDAGHVFRRDALAAVGHVDASKAFLAPGADGQHPAVFHGVAGVEE